MSLGFLYVMGVDLYSVWQAPKFCSANSLGALLPKILIEIILAIMCEFLNLLTCDLLIIRSVSLWTVSLAESESITNSILFLLTAC